MSAYDKGGKIRLQQSLHLRTFIKEVLNNNKYVIIGGDWNHLLDKSLYKEDMPDWVGLLPDSLFDTSYKMVYDSEINTVRSENQPYIKGENFETIIDGFLVSPGIDVVKVKATDHEFEYTDHNPVTITFKLKK